MSAAPTIRSVERALQVFDYLVRCTAPQPLRAVHAATQLPKPTLLSILQTLSAAGMAVQEAEGWSVPGEWMLQVQGFINQRIARNVQRSRPR